MVKFRQLPWGQFGQAALMGLVGSCGFPQSLPTVAKAPLLDGFCRELFLLLYACWLYRHIWSQTHARLRWAVFYTSSFCFYAGLIWWLDIAMEQFGGVPMPLALVALGFVVGISALLTTSTLFFTLLLDVFAWLPRPVIFATGWILQEYVRGQCTQFPWGQWGYALARDLYLVQWASVGGVWLVGFGFACFGGYLQQACTQTGIGRKRSIWSACLLWVVAHGFGYVLYRYEAPAQSMYRVGVVQANISQDIKNDSALYHHQIVASYQKLSQRLAYSDVDLIVWPEGAWPGYLQTDLKDLDLLKLHKPLLFGAGMFEKKASVGQTIQLPQTHYTLYNSAIYLDANARVQGYYHKQQLVPFGEYVPFRKLLPLKKLVPSLVDFSAGQKPVLLGPERLGILICYDGVFPQYARQATRAGARLLVNLTNDGWYGQSAAAYQHRDFYIFRAIETGRWIVRAANTGISVAIDPKGRMHGQTALNTETTAWMQVGLVAEQRYTLYTRFGNWLVWCGFMLLAAAAVRWYRDACRQR